MMPERPFRSRFWKSLLVLCILCAWVVATAFADDQKSAALPHISKQTRVDMIRAFNAELVYIRSAFPMGTKGLTLKDGKISPGATELQQMLAMWGPAVKPGDQARISNIEIKNNLIHFEINGGPIKHSKWYQRISVGGMGGETPIAPTDSSANPRGSYVDLVFDNYVPELDANQLKALLRPVFDFNSKSVEEAYLDTVPPKVKAAIQQHRVLVGMDREMVIYAKGRPPRKIREKEDDTEYEEWVFGEPPQDVDFVRFSGDEVVRVETMTVSGDKTIRTAREVEIKPQPDTTAQASKPESRPVSAPTLRRPGEDLPESAPGLPVETHPLPIPAPPPQQTSPSSGPQGPQSLDARA